MTDTEVIRDARVRTERAALVTAFAGHGPIRILVETSTDSEWVAQTLEAAGHTVVVIDPTFAPTYGTRSRAAKTDRRDVEALAEANRRGWYRAAYRVSRGQRAVRQLLAARQQVVRARAGVVSLVRALLRQEGLRARGMSTACFADGVRALTLPAAVHRAVAPLLRVLDTLSDEIAAFDAEVATVARADGVIARLQTAPGVGVIVSTAFRAFIDEVQRFTRADQVSAALGLVPREDSSGERQRRGHISKAGPRDLRALLVQAAWSCWRSRAGGALRAWAERLAGRRGKRIAIVALARRLSRILFAMWRDDTVFRTARVA
jgi:transposase